MSPNINHVFKHCSKIFKVVLGFFYMLMLIFVCDDTEYNCKIQCFQAVWRRGGFFWYNTAEPWNASYMS